MMKRLRASLRLGAASALALAVVAAAPNVTAQAYPSRPVRIVVPFAPGGVADITARVLAQALTESLHEQFLVDNRPSAGGVVASETVAKARPDGYTLLFMTNGNAVTASLFKSLPYDTMADFAPVSTVGFFDIVLVVDGSSPFKSVRELIAYAKTHPGKLNIGTVNVGSTQNLAAELFKSTAGVDLQVVPYKGTADVMTALRGGAIQAAFEIVAPLLSQLKGGSVRALGVASARRFAGLPDVPSLAEAGVPNYQAASWNAVAAPAKTPDSIVEQLNRAINDALVSPNIRLRLLELGVDARGSTPQALRELLAAEIVRWRTVIEKAGIERQ